MSNPTFHLEGLLHDKGELQDFEGPLQLILMLLAKNKIEIRDIQISLILEQYLAYINEMQEMDLEIASEFVQMASHLVYIKARMLLPKEENEVSELDALISSLENLKCRDSYSQILSVIPFFEKACDSGARMFQKPPEPLKKSIKYSYDHKPWELLMAFSAILNRGFMQPDVYTQSAIPRPMIYGVRNKSREIIEELSVMGKSYLRDLYKRCRSRTELVATFISVLELCSMGNLFLNNDEDGEIVVTFIGGKDIESILDSISD